MGQAAGGAMNSQGFSQAIQSNQLPSEHHITHTGIFNETYFEIGEKANDLMEIHYGLGFSNCFLSDFAKRNYFLSCFMKSSADGQQRTRPLNIVVALDVSGSMNGRLSQTKSNDSRLSLSRRAIMMLYGKLQSEDAFSLVTFHTSAKTIIQSDFVKNFNYDAINQLVNSSFQTGGTTVKAGFDQSLKNLHRFMQNNTLIGYENRIVLLTDVCDNSVADENVLIEKISNQNIHTTIIGVSTDFKSSTCEKLIKVKGFNYMCAVEDSDLQTYLVDQFDYTFFPCTQEITISLTSNQIGSISVYGSVDHDVIYESTGNEFTITKSPSGFPSALDISKEGKIRTKGGLILVKFNPKEEKELPEVHLDIKLEYKDMDGKTYQKIYKVDEKIEAEEYYSDEAIKTGIQLFYYTESIRKMLPKMREGQNKLDAKNTQMYLELLNQLDQICPPQKIDQLKQLKQVVAHYQLPIELVQ